MRLQICSEGENVSGTPSSLLFFSLSFCFLHAPSLSYIYPFSLFHSSFSLILGNVVIVVPIFLPLPGSHKGQMGSRQWDKNADHCSTLGTSHLERIFNKICGSIKVENNVIIQIIPVENPTLPPLKLQWSDIKLIQNDLKFQTASLVFSEDASLQTHLFPIP